MKIYIKGQYVKPVDYSKVLRHPVTYHYRPLNVGVVSVLQVCVDDAHASTEQEHRDQARDQW